MFTILFTTQENCVEENRRKNIVYKPSYNDLKLYIIHVLYVIITLQRMEFKIVITQFLDHISMSFFRPFHFLRENDGEQISTLGHLRYL